MINFTDDERAYLTEMRALATDAHGQEVLVGLSFEETAFYVNYSKQALTNTHDPDHTDKYLELNQKHEAARFGVIGAEAELRADNPSRH